ncbi:GlsB/YeaQ/YmgE family stress response membrane protein [Pseudonocardia alaniniphila]|uniref:GlsB/YeaQ/YmgE family stress response membrane protein n=1 Tax=Pseudonocardia alaniniphila TaxID=75291 RepID=A0ABS9TKW9_9PSEU|nr:GlsB/YeaQ/YmgE family stress response membrane protein [Pseudonocardia alaniniphila]MCH6169184.1 GlsB/YeaQ/YmgE family stress response membrane protein [Pseudonocardia alaniniphila]
MTTTTAIDPALFAILTALVIGLVIGGVGRKYASRRQGIPAWRSILDAVVGAFGGTAIAHLIGLPTWALFFQVVMATLAVFVVTPAYRRRFARR